jgi:creatinine amidohydrolase/Fe(II)-dependent formamide hydrolase-like protein
MGVARRWDLMTSPEIADAVRKGMDLALLPVGATEQHGPHLATGCDTISPEEIAWRVAERTGVVVLPAIPYGISLGHTSHWAGTVSLHPQTLTQLVLEIARWVLASGFSKLIMLNGNGPNVPALECARIQLRHEFRAAVFACSPSSTARNGCSSTIFPTQPIFMPTGERRRCCCMSVRAPCVRTRWWMRKTSRPARFFPMTCRR